MIPYYSDGFVTLYHGDNAVVLSALPTHSVDVVVTSPPYNLGGDFHSSNHKTVSSARRRNSYGGYSEDDNDDLPEEEYQAKQVSLLDELYRIVKPTGWVFYNHKNRIKGGRLISPLTWIQKTEWVIYQDIILDRMGSTNNDKRRFFPSHEIIFVLSAGAGILFNESNLTTVWRVPRVHRAKVGHPASFHVALPLRCLSACVGENLIVLDPYMGIGSSGIAARQKGWKFIGVERILSYVEMSKHNIIIDTIPQRLF